MELTKYITKFNSQAEYDAAKTQLDYPNLTLIKGSNQILYNQEKEDNDYVEIAGIKWATMNIGATGVTDYGLYFQWADSSGYTESQVGSGSGKKYFAWSDYKYSRNGGSYDDDMLKYNDMDGLTTLDSSDDAATVYWGSNWRMPTYNELDRLQNMSNITWVSNYQGSGINGLVCTDKSDSSKSIFLPAAGFCDSGIVASKNSVLTYWSNAVTPGRVNYAYQINADSSGHWSFTSYSSRYVGGTVRAVKIN